MVYEPRRSLIEEWLIRMLPRTLFTRSARFLLEDWNGELWLVFDSADMRAPRIVFRPELGALIFESVAETRVLAPSPRSWQQLGAEQLAQCYHAATRLQT
jgi:hypothetical protein